MTTNSDRRRSRLSVRVYLTVLVALFAILAIGLNLYGRAESASDARDSTLERMEFQASLAADEVNSAIAAAQANVATLAANPGLDGLTAPSSDCSLTFAPDAFPHGHLDVISADGFVVCTSLPGAIGEEVADEGWRSGLDAEPTVGGPVDDAITGEQSIVVASGMPSGGAIAAFLSIEGLPETLRERYGGPLGAVFELGPDVGPRDGRVTGTAELDAIDWVVAAWVDTSVATANADATNRQLLWILLAGLGVVAAATVSIYRGLARPIEQLHAWVRSSAAGDIARPPAPTRPAELVALADDFRALTHDMTTELDARVAAEQMARASAESYRLLFDANPQPMWLHARDTGRLLQVNRAMVERFGRSREELLAMSVGQLIADVDTGFLEAMQGESRIDRGGPWSLLGRDDDLIDCEVTSDVLAVDGTDARLVIAEDVTAQRRTEQLLRRAERMDSLGQLAGGMAHDFNNVLAVIMSYAEFASEAMQSAAAEDPARWQPVLDDVHQIGAASQRAAELTKQLLAFARGEATMTVPLDLREVVANVQGMLSRTLGERIDVRVAMADDLWIVRADRGELEQVIVNLAVNARDAMPDGGTLSIETSNVEVDEHNTAARPDLNTGRYVRLRVSDTGVGMDPAVRDKAFNPFFTTKARGSGTGLGLATVYGIATRAGGSVQIYSEPGLGTSISVMLPATSEPVAAPMAERADRPKSSDALIMIVEDDGDIRSVAERILHRAGYRVVTAADGFAALELAEQLGEGIDLVLTDVVMPGMLGSDLVRALRERWPRIRVLLMSGYAPPIAPQDRVDETRDSPLLDKPFSAGSLLDKVHEVLSSNS